MADAVTFPPIEILNMNLRVDIKLCHWFQKFLFSLWYNHLSRFSNQGVQAERITLWAFILWSSHARVTSVMSVSSLSSWMDAFKISWKSIVMALMTFRNCDRKRKSWMKNGIFFISFVKYKYSCSCSVHEKEYTLSCIIVIEMLCLLSHQIQILLWFWCSGDWCTNAMINT